MVTKTKKAIVQVRVDEDVKRRAGEVLNGLGMDTSTAINVFLRQVITENGLPFRPHHAQFNEDTRAAVMEADEMVKNRSGKRFTSADDLFKDALGEQE